MIAASPMAFWLGQRTATFDQGKQPPSHVMQTFRQTRSAERQSQIAILETMIVNDALSYESRAAAEEHLFQTLWRIEFETVAEALIIAKMGFRDVVVAHNNGNTHILVRECENLTDYQVEDIKEILEKILNHEISWDNIFVSVIT